MSAALLTCLSGLRPANRMIIVNAERVCGLVDQGTRLTCNVLDALHNAGFLISLVPQPRRSPRKQPHPAAIQCHLGYNGNVSTPAATE